MVTRTSFRLTIPKHPQCSGGRVCAFLWKALVKMPCARRECRPPRPYLNLRTPRTIRDREGRWEPPCLGWRVILLAWDGLVMPGGPYLRVVVPHWHRKETHGPHIPHPALRAVMASSGAILKRAAGVLLRPQAERQARRGLSPAPSLSTFFATGPLPRILN